MSDRTINIDLVPYSVTKTTDSLGKVWHEVDNFIGMDGIEHVIKANPFGEAMGELLGCPVYVEDTRISVNTNSFEKFSDVCLTILAAYDSVGWELLDRVSA